MSSANSKGSAHSKHYVNANITLPSTIRHHPMSSANSKGSTHSKYFVNADISVNHVAPRECSKRATHSEQIKKEIIYNVSAVTRDNDKGHLQP